MDSYKIAKNSIIDILNRPQITYDGTYISAYELKECIDKEFSDLYQIFNTEKIINVINQDSDTTIPKVKKVLFDYMSYKDASDSYNLCYNEYKICFLFSNNSICESLELIKESDNDDLGINYKKDMKRKKLTDREKKFIIDNIEYITNTFEVLKYISNLNNTGVFTIINSEIRAPWQKTEFKIPYSDIILIFEIEKETKITIKYTKERLNNIYYTEWLNKESIEEFVNSNIDEILKKIKIPISALEPIFKDIIKKNQTKSIIKQLKK